MNENFLTEEQFRALPLPADAKPRLSVEDIEGNTDLPRTLLYGYTVNRYTWHVYVAFGLIHRDIYYGGSSVNAPVYARSESARSWPISDLLPDKRLYPERCDVQIVSWILAQGFRLPFTNYGGAGTNKRHGKDYV